MIANQREDLIPKSSKYEIEIIEAAKNNLPDDQSAAGALKILELCQNLGSKDGLLVCCSGKILRVEPLPGIFETIWSNPHFLQKYPVPK